MIQATFRFAGHPAEERSIGAVPPVGDLIDGPAEDAILWRVSAVSYDAAAGTAFIVCEAVAAPEIRGDEIFGGMIRGVPSDRQDFIQGKQND